MFLHTDIDMYRELENILCNNNVLVACIGSPLRRDDSAGLVLCNKLISRGFKLLLCEYGLENCIDEIINTKPRVLLIIDAIYSEKLEPGDIALIDFNQIESKEISFTSTHNIPINIVIEFIKQTTPLDKIYLLGLMVKNIDIGIELSLEVEKSIEKIMEIITQTLERCRDNYNK